MRSSKKLDYVKATLKRDFQVINTDEVKLIKIFKGISPRELIAYVLYTIALSCILYCMYNMAGNGVLTKIGTWTMLYFTILLNIIVVIMIRILKRLDIVFKSELLVFDKKAGAFLKKNKNVCRISQVRKVQIDVHGGADDWNYYKLYIVLKDGNKENIYNTGNKIVYDLADEIADFFDVKVSVNNSR